MVSLVGSLRRDRSWIAGIKRRFIRAILIFAVARIVRTCVHKIAGITEIAGVVVYSDPNDCSDYMETRLYTRTKCEPWTKLIEIRQLTWLGHMMRLHPETPTRNAFEKYLRKVKRPQGRPKTTWMQTLRHDLSKIGIKLDLLNATKTLNKLFELTQSRTDRSNIVKRVVQ